MAREIGKFNKAEAKSLLDDLYSFINENDDGNGLPSVVSSDTIKVLNQRLWSLHDILKLDESWEIGEFNKTEVKSLLDDLYSFINENDDGNGFPSAVSSDTIKALNQHLWFLYDILTLDKP